MAEKKGYDLHREWREHIAQQLKAMIDSGEAGIGEALMEAMRIEAYTMISGVKIGAFELRTWKEKKDQHPSIYTLDDADLAARDTVKP